MTGEFEKKVVLVTGASHPEGIGAACAVKFASLGALVAIHSRSEGNPLAEQVLEIIRSYGNGHLLIGDLSDPDVPEQMIRELKDRWKRLDVLVNNAGVEISKPLPMLSAEDWRNSMWVNTLAPSLLIKSAYRHRLFPREGAVVVNIASIVGQYYNDGQAAYAASKAALIALTETAARDLGRAGIRVNAVLPGFVRTKMTSGLPVEALRMIEKVTPLGRFCTPEDVAEAVVFLAGPRASFISGAELRVDGGLGPIFTGIAPLLKAGARLPETK